VDFIVRAKKKLLTAKAAEKGRQGREENLGASIWGRIPVYISVLGVPCTLLQGDPSLRLKNGCAQDDNHDLKLVLLDWSLL